MNLHLEKNVTFFTEQPVSDWLSSSNCYTLSHTPIKISSPQILLKEPLSDFSMFDILLCTAVIQCQGSEKELKLFKALIIHDHENTTWYLVTRAQKNIPPRSRRLLEWVLDFDFETQAAWFKWFWTVGVRRKGAMQGHRERGCMWKSEEDSVG